ncbi:ABC-F family ATP-binding cassette domain-containing protein [Clostridium baratii]|uniref:ABC-F family ATP-binding cassette domain-containing protein n=1 Tax=Clostridium baratii TaxID=1561 RepID=UPI00097FA900|nr:ABC-F family ATP-binding cassette domain-containing protein [Clostridium baratii]AQM61506.1 thiamine ABC transporter substrate-binding protein [Clostridium baratii]STA99166.1 ABC transporter, ATP-binding protein [Clostridium baratii]
MIVLSCRNIKKSYGIQDVLKDVTLSVNEGDKVGIIGPNGEGKSTLFKILSKNITPDDGDMFIDKNKTIGYLSQHLSLQSDNTIYEEVSSVFQHLINLENKIKDLEIKMKEPYDEANASYHEKLIKDYTTSQELYENRGGYTYRGNISKVLKGLGFLEDDFNKVITTLSGGQKTRIALCKLLLQNPDILLLDEPTNHLDLEAIEWLEEFLKSYKGTLLVISHDRFFLDAVTNRTFQVINGHVNCYNAPYTKYLELKEKDYEAKLKAYNLQQAEIQRQEEIIQKFRSFNREKSIRRAESREKALEKMERLDAPDKEKGASKIQFETAVKSGYDVLHIENLSKSFEDKNLFNNISFDLKRGEKIALIGDNGRGKTTLLNIIMGKLKADSGKTILGTNVNVGYYDQEQSDLDQNKTILDEVWDAFPDLTTTRIRTALGSFLFTGDDVFKEIKNLSGGEKCRINILKLMLSQSNFLLLDEPTNHLDIPSREALENAILNYDGSMLIVSHDRYFLNKVINKIVELKETGMDEYLGNYNYYMEKKQNPSRFEVYEEVSNGKTKTQVKEEKKKVKLAQKEIRIKKTRLREVESSISENEALLEKLNNDLCLEEIYSNPKEAERVNKEISNTEITIESLYEEWETLSEELNN